MFSRAVLWHVTEEPPVTQRAKLLPKHINRVYDLLPAAAVATLVGVLALSAGCTAPATTEAAGDVKATYNEKTGKLAELTMNAKKDGKPDVFSYMDGSKFVRIEIDNDENGSIDRWEYYGADQTLERVGFSRANDGIADAWAFHRSDGSIERVEVSTKQDGKPNRTEFYEKGALARAEEDTNGDGRVDKWERYESGALVSVSFDTTRSGKPTTTIDYRKP